MYKLYRRYENLEYLKGISNNYFLMNLKGRKGVICDKSKLKSPVLMQNRIFGAGRRSNLLIKSTWLI